MPKVSERIAMVACVLAVAAAIDYRVGQSPVKASSPEVCRVTYGMYQRLEVSVAEWSAFGDCRDGAEMTYETSHNARMPLLDRESIWRFPAEGGRSVMVHCFRGNVIAKYWM